MIATATVKEPATSSNSAKVTPGTAAKKTTSETRPKISSETLSATTIVSAMAIENAKMDFVLVRPEISATELSASTVLSVPKESANALVAGRESAARKEIFASMLNAKMEEPAMK